MNEDVARVIAAASVGATVFGIGVAVLFSARESRVRLPMDILMVWVTAGALAGVAIVSGVHTDPLLVVGAGALGFVLGTAQGTQLRVRREGGRLFARRGAIALAVWGAGLITIQTASLASRENIVEIGQAVSYFGVGGAFGLIVGRETAIRRLAPAGAAALALAGALAFPSVRQPVHAQDPEIIEITARTSSEVLAALFAESGASGDPTDAEFTIRLPALGGPVTGEGQIVVEDFNLGLLLHSFELLGEAVGGAIVGADEEPDDERPISAELINCRAESGIRTNLEGSFDAVTGVISGPVSGTLYFANLTNCPGDIASGDFATIPGTWNASFVLGELTGEITFDVDGTLAVFPLEGAVDAEPEPSGSSGGSSGSEDPEASPEDPANTEAEDPDGEDGETPPPVIAPPVSLDDIKPEEAAGVGIIGAGAAGLVGLASAASAASSAPTGAPVAVFEQPAAKKPEDDEPEPGPGKREHDPIGPEDVDQAAENIIRMAGKENYEDILRAVRGRMENGTIDAATLETLRQILKDRMAIDAALASSDLMNKPDWQVFAEGFREDLAKAADLFGMGIVIRDPLLVTRILAAVHTAGASEVVFFPAQVAGALWDRANSAGQEIRTTGDAAREVAGVIGVEVATEVASELLGAGILKGGGAALDAFRGARKGANLTDLAKAVRGGSLDEAMEGAGRALPPAGALDEAAEGAGRSVPSGGAMGEAAEGGVQLPSRSVVPKVDNIELKGLPNNTRLSDNHLAATGYAKEALDDIQRIAKENNVLIGTRATNPASAWHLANGKAVPKPLHIKPKTTNPLDLYIGGRPENEGLASLFRPTKPNAADFTSKADYDAVMKRFNERMEEYEKYRQKLPELQAKHGVQYDEATGLLTNKAGKPFAGDIDGVYVKDASTGQYLGPGNPTYDKVMGEFRGSAGIQGQHGFETGMVVDISRDVGPAAIPGAMKDHSGLSLNHELGKEILIEAGPDGFVKGARPWGLYDVMNPGESPLKRGIPMALPDE